MENVTIEYLKPEWFWYLQALLSTVLIGSVAAIGYALFKLIMHEVKGGKDEN